MPRGGVGLRRRCRESASGERSGIFGDQEDRRSYHVASELTYGNEVTLKIIAGGADIANGQRWGESSHGDDRQFGARMEIRKDGEIGSFGPDGVSPSLGRERAKRG